MEQTTPAFPFAQALQKIRELRNLSQGALGERIGVNQSTISRYETDNRVPDSYMLMRLAASLQIQAELFFSLTPPLLEHLQLVPFPVSLVPFPGGQAANDEGKEAPLSSPIALMPVALLFSGYAPVPPVAGGIHEC